MLRARWGATSAWRSGQMTGVGWGREILAWPIQGQMAVESAAEKGPAVECGRHPSGWCGAP